jgi:UDP-N-acetyl-D-galactosamine dehydrogenase
MKTIMKNDIPARGLRIAVLGLAFKENCPDIRNTKVVDIMHELREYGMAPLACDPYVDPAAALDEYGIEMTNMPDITGMDALVVTTAHTRFRNMTIDEISSLYRKDCENPRILFDIFGIFDKEKYERAGYLYWRL